MNVKKLIKLSLSERDYYFENLKEASIFIDSKQLTNANMDNLVFCYGWRQEKNGQEFYYLVDKKHGEEFEKTTAKQQVEEESNQVKYYGGAHFYYFDKSVLNLPNNQFHLVCEYIGGDGHDTDYASENYYHTILRADDKESDKDYSTDKVDERALYVTDHSLQLCTIKRSKKIFLGENAAQLEEKMNQELTQVLSMFNEKKRRIDELKKEVGEMEEVIKTLGKG